MTFYCIFRDIKISSLIVISGCQSIVTAIIWEHLSAEEYLGGLWAHMDKSSFNYKTHLHFFLSKRVRAFYLKVQPMSVKNDTIQ